MAATHTTRTDPQLIQPWISKTVAILMDRDELTTEEAADRIDLSPQVFRSRLRGDTQWTVSDLMALAYLFRVGIDQLVNGINGFVPPPRDFGLARESGSSRASKKKTRRQRKADDGPVVAGAGFEPATFGL